MYFHFLKFQHYNYFFVAAAAVADIAVVANKVAVAGIGIAVERVFVDERSIIEGKYDFIDRFGSMADALAGYFDQNLDY